MAGQTTDFRLYAIRVFVDDWPRAWAFYEQAVGLALKLSDEAHGWAEFDLGGASLAVERIDHGDAEGEALIGRYVGASLEVADVEATYAQLRARGVEFTSPPERQDWGGMLAHFRDPEGNVLTLVGPGA